VWPDVRTYYEECSLLAASPLVGPVFHGRILRVDAGRSGHYKAHGETATTGTLACSRLSLTPRLRTARVLATNPTAIATR
jgi:hypothetical protein